MSSCDQAKKKWYPLSEESVVEIVARLELEGRLTGRRGRPAYIPIQSGGARFCLAAMWNEANIPIGVLVRRRSRHLLFRVGITGEDCLPEMLLE